MPELKVVKTIWDNETVFFDDLFYFTDFDVQKFLEKQKCFLATYKIDDSFYSDWLTHQCRLVNINPKIVIIFLIP